MKLLILAVGTPLLPNKCKKMRHKVDGSFIPSTLWEVLHAIRAYMSWLGVTADVKKAVHLCHWNDSPAPPKCIVSRAWTPPLLQKWKIKESESLYTVQKHQQVSRRDLSSVCPKCSTQRSVDVHHWSQRKVRGLGNRLCCDTWCAYNSPSLLRSSTFDDSLFCGFSN